MVLSKSFSRGVLLLFALLLTAFDLTALTLDERKLAIAKWTETIKQNPKDAEALCNRGELEMNAGDCAKAVEDFTAAIELNPNQERAYKDRGRCLSRFCDALRKFDEEKYVKIGNFNAIKAAGEKRDTQALSDLRRTIDSYPDQAENFLDLAILEKSLQLPEWLAHCSKVVDLDPKCVAAYELRADYYQQQQFGAADGKASKEFLRLALADYTKLIELEPNSPEWYLDRAMCYQGENPQYDPQHVNTVIYSGDDPKLIAQALVDIDQAIKLDPTFESSKSMRPGDSEGCWRPYAYRAELHLRQRRLDLALADCDALAKAVPEIKELCESRKKGLTERMADREKELAEKAEAKRLAIPAGLLSDKKYAEAVAECSNLIAANSEDVGAMAIRGDAWFGTKEFGKASLDYENVLKLNPHFGTDKERERMLSFVCSFYATSGKFDQAFALAEGIFTALAPDNHVGDLGAADLRSMILLQRGRSFEAEGKTEQAIIDYSAVIEADSSAPLPYLARGKACTRLKPPEFGRAKDDFNACTERSRSTYLDGPEVSARKNWTEGEANQAMAELLPDHDPMFLTGAIYDYRLAAKDAAQAIAFGRDVPDYDKMLAEKLPRLKNDLLVMLEDWIKNGHRDRAVCYDTLIADDPDNLVLLLARAAAYERDGHKQDAAGARLEVYSHLSNSKLPVPDLQKMAGYYVEMKDFSSAIFRYDQILEGKPDEMNTYVLKGKALIELDRNADAIETLDHVPVDSPLYSVAQYQRKIAVTIKEADEKWMADFHAKFRAMVAENDAQDRAIAAAKVRQEAVAEAQSQPHFDLCSKCEGRGYYWHRELKPARVVRRVMVRDTSYVGFWHEETYTEGGGTHEDVIEICPVCHGSKTIQR